MARYAGRDDSPFEGIPCFPDLNPVSNTTTGGWRSCYRKVTGSHYYDSYHGQG